MKRKYEAETSTSNSETQPFKKSHLSSTHTPEIHSQFHPTLFEPKTLTTYQVAYQNSTPYRHGVIPALISDHLLRSVRTEILTHISFTPKETDIYKIQQSGDLANLDGLDSAQLTHLPSLVTLRDALYSAEFRAFLEDVTDAGKLSGKKTDMAINIYTPGSYLLCHDDVIGTRRVSYILYLTNPDEPWQAEWGGGLRLYVTEKKRNKTGEEVKVPMPEHVKVIPPAWGQLSFFAVQPGESFHDVEEVYHPQTGRQEEGKKRVRMAISGWYHIPQEGEDGYEEGLEQNLAGKSSLSQLQGKEADEFDEPQPQFLRFDQVDEKHAEQDLKPEKAGIVDNDPTLLTEADLNLLLQYISPSYLTPEMTEQLNSSFGENSFLQLDRFLCDRFSDSLRECVSQHEKLGPDANTNEKKCREWRTARPPHKHRFSFQQPALGSRGSPVTIDASSEDLPLKSLMTHLFPSTAFRKWLSITTGLTIDGDASFDLLARRFRRGKDYALASTYEGENPRLEFSLGCTVSSGWETDEAGHDDDGHANGDGSSAQANRVALSANGKNVSGNENKINDTANHVEVGGEEIYMAGDDDDKSVFSEKNGASSAAKDAPRKSDPAIYTHDEDNDAILFTDPPVWNRFSVVLRDRGTLRFVKYVSAAAEGDRWDIKGVVEAGEGGWGDDEVGEEEEGGEDGETEEHVHEDGTIVDSGPERDNQEYSSTGGGRIRADAEEDEDDVDDSDSDEEELDSADDDARQEEYDFRYHELLQRTQRTKDDAG